MNSLQKRLLLLLVLLATILFQPSLTWLLPQKVFSDWSTDVDPPTTPITASGTDCVAEGNTLNCPSSTTNVNLSISCDDGSGVGCRELYYKTITSGSCPMPSYPAPAGFTRITSFPTTISVLSSNGSSQTVCAFGIDNQGNIQSPAQTQTITFLSFSSPWFQGKGGDMRRDYGFSDALPSGKYASENGGGGTPGVIFTGGTTANFGSGGASENQYNWVVGGSSYPETYFPTPQTSYASYQALLAQNGVTTTALPSSCNNPSGCSLTTLSASAYTSTGDVYLVASSLSSGNYVFLVNGNLTIKGNVLVANGATATFIASGDIKIDKDVRASSNSTLCTPPTGCQVEGFFSADRKFIVEGYGFYGCLTQGDATDDDRRLNISGAVVANAGLAMGTDAFENERNLCDDGASYPSLYIVERPDFILNAPSFIKTKSLIWQEVAPAGDIPGDWIPTPTPTPTSTPTPTPIPPTPTPTSTPTPTRTPTPTPTPVPKRVFLASETYRGNLGGLTGADNKCQTLANNAGLGGTWKAWLSDGSTSALSRLLHSAVPYKLVDGTLIANNWDDLITNGPRTAINKDQTSNTITSSLYVWTNTLRDGSRSGTSNCSDWSSPANSVFGVNGYGSSFGSDGLWTHYDPVTTAPCSNYRRLYCFEQ